jgi:hypothetical protein
MSVVIACFLWMLVMAGSFLERQADVARRIEAQQRKATVTTQVRELSTQDLVSSQQKPLAPTIAPKASHETFLMPNDGDQIYSIDVLTDRKLEQKIPADRARDFCWSCTIPGERFVYTPSCAVTIEVDPKTEERSAVEHCPD